MLFHSCLYFIFHIFLEYCHNTATSLLAFRRVLKTELFCRSLCFCTVGLHSDVVWTATLTNFVRCPCSRFWLYATLIFSFIIIIIIITCVYGWHILYLHYRYATDQHICIVCNALVCASATICRCSQYVQLTLTLTLTLTLSLNSSFSTVAQKNGSFRTPKLEVNIQQMTENSWNYFKDVIYFVCH